MSDLFKRFDYFDNSTDGYKVFVRKMKHISSRPPPLPDKKLKKKGKEPFFISLLILFLHFYSGEGGVCWRTKIFAMRETFLARKFWRKICPYHTPDSLIDIPFYLFTLVTATGFFIEFL